MAGSLDSLARSFPGSQLRLDPFGAAQFGSLGQVAGGALEGALFSAAIVAAMLLARRNLPDER